MKARIPAALILSRALLGVAIPLLSAWHVPQYPLLAVILLTTGLLTDIFDGIIARRLGVSSPGLRRLDSTVDQLFFVCVVIATIIQRPGFFEANLLKIGILFGLEAATYALSFLRFRKEVATHSIGAKLWTLLIFATLVQVILRGDSRRVFDCCFWAGVVTRLEIIAILLTLRSWTNDVPTLYHAIRLRHGKPIRRHRLFNG